MPITFHSGVSQSSGISSNGGITEHAGISGGEGAPPPPQGDLYWHFDISDPTTVDLIGGEVVEWRNKSTSGIAQGDLLDDGVPFPEFITEYGNQLPGASFSSLEGLKAIGTAPQPSTLFIVYRNVVWNTGREFVSGDTTNHARNIINDGISSNCGSTLQINSNNIGLNRLSFLYTAVIDSTSSTIYFKNFLFDLFTSGDLGVNDQLDLFLGVNGASAPLGAVFEIRWYQDALDDVERLTIADELISKWINEYPSSICTIWGDPTSFPDIAVIGSNINTLFDRLSFPGAGAGTLTQGVVANQPILTTINSLRAMSFDGVSDNMVQASYNMPARFIYIVLEVPLPVSNKVIFESLVLDHRLEIDVSGSPVFKFTTDNGVNSISVPFSSTPTFLIIEIAGVNSNIYKNNDAPVSGTLTENIMRQLRIGSDWAQTNFLAMTMGEWGLGESINNSEIEDLKDYLQRWV